MGENHPYEKYKALSIKCLYFHYPETVPAYPRGWQCPPRPSALRDMLAPVARLLNLSQLR